MMDWKELSKALHKELDNQLKSCKACQPPDSIVDLELKFTAVGDDDIVETTVAQTELVELVDGTWIVENSVTSRSTTETTHLLVGSP